MNTLPRIHLSIVQPPNYVHSLGFIDQARYFRHQFRRMGAEVTLAQNRLRHDAVNFIFGAHLGFDAELRQRYSCIFVNLEQLGQGGARVTPEYMQLLASSAVVDYDADNIPAYASHPEEVLVVPFLHAPYLKPAQPIPLEERPIDLLFIGSMNDRRRQMIQRIESTGVQVSMFDGALYGPERDAYIRQAKAVFNAHFYESSRFEQARVSQCLSLGTPVISERREQTRPHPAFEDSVLWLDTTRLESYFASHFGTPGFFAQARAALVDFERADPIAAYADVLAFAAGFGKVHQERRPQGLWQPQQLHLGGGKAYQPGWLNIDVSESAVPDLLLDLAQPVEWPLQFSTPLAGDIELQPDSVDTIYTTQALQSAGDLARLMDNCLTLLRTGGRLIAEVPHEQAAAAWQSPRHVRAFNEASWNVYTEGFAQLGWFEHRFEMTHFEYLDGQRQTCERAQATRMRLALTKVDTTPQERTQARLQFADYGVPDDEVLPSVDEAGSLAA
ncbi:MAG: hypothetical protein QM742_11205 [Aquabacterium sp.]